MNDVKPDHAGGAPGALPPQAQKKPAAELPPPARHGHWRQLGRVLLVLAVFAFGMVCGGALTLVGVVRHVREGARHPERRVERTTRWLSHRLHLSAAQKERVRAILQAQQADFAALRREVQPRVVARLEQTDQEIRDILEAGQKEEWQRIVERIRRQWLPPAEAGTTH